MDFKQLEAFVAVAKCGSFSRAGSELYLSQPTVSSHIKNLEDELCVKLLDRTTKEVALSAEGRRFFTYACEMLEMRENAVCAVKETPLSRSSVIRIAASSVPEQFILPEIISEFRKKHPNVAFQIIKGDSQQVARSVALREADLGLAGAICDTQRCDYRRFASDELVLIGQNTPEIRLLMTKDISADDFLKMSFIMREEGSGTKREFEVFLQSIGLSVSNLKISATLSDTLAIMRMAESGVGVGIVSRHAAHSFNGECIILPLTKGGFSRSLYTVVRKGRCPSGVAGELLRFIHKHYESEDIQNGFAQCFRA